MTNDNLLVSNETFTKLEKITLQYANDRINLQDAWDAMYDVVENDEVSNISAMDIDYLIAGMSNGIIQ